MLKGFTCFRIRSKKLKVAIVIRLGNFILKTVRTMASRVVFGIVCLFVLCGNVLGEGERRLFTGRAGQLGRMQLLWGKKKEKQEKKNEK